MSTSPLPEERLYLAITHNASLMRKLAENSLLPHRLTLAEYSCLRIIEHHPHITAQEIGERLGTSAPSMAQLISRLHKKKLLIRKSHRDDARRLHLLLTPLGKALLRKARTSLMHALRQLRLSKILLGSTVKNLTSLQSSLSSHIFHG
jgi:DNA-binding MarR family transcriptional regulator